MLDVVGMQYSSCCHSPSIRFTQRAKVLSLGCILYLYDSSPTENLPKVCLSFNVPAKRWYASGTDLPDARNHLSCFSDLSPTSQSSSESTIPMYCMHIYIIALQNQEIGRSIS